MKQVTITFTDGSQNVLPVTASSTVKFEWLTAREGMTAAHNEDVYALGDVASVQVADAALAVTASQPEVAANAEQPVVEPVAAADGTTDVSSETDQAT